MKNNNTVSTAIYHSDGNPQITIYNIIYKITITFSLHDFTTVPKNGKQKMKSSAITEDTCEIKQCDYCFKSLCDQCLKINNWRYKIFGMVKFIVI